MYIHKAAALAAAVLLTGRVLGAPIPGESPSNEEKSASTIANSADSTVSETDACKDKSLDEKCKWNDETQGHKVIEGTCQIQHDYAPLDGDEEKKIFHTVSKICSDKKLPGPKSAPKEKN